MACQQPVRCVRHVTACQRASQAAPLSALATRVGAAHATATGAGNASVRGGTLRPTGSTELSLLRPVRRLLACWCKELARRATGIAGQACLEMRPFTAFETAGMRTVCGRTDLKNYIPDQAAEAVRGLRSAGAVIMGRSNMPAGHQDVQADNPVFGPSSHPWDTARTSGGSAGGGRPTSPACTGTSRQGDRSPSSDMFPTARGRDGGQRPTWPAAAHRSATHVTSSRSCRRWSGRRTTTSASPAHCASARDRTR
jgi:hypothetical protein